MAQTLAELARQRILLLDGAMGTMIQDHNLDEAEGMTMAEAERWLRPNLAY